MTCKHCRYCIWLYPTRTCELGKEYSDRKPSWSCESFERAEGSDDEA